MRTSEHTDKLDAALAKAQGALTNPDKRKRAKVVGTTKAGKRYEYEYKYADIADGIDICRPVLSKHGIGVVQGTRIEGGVVILETRLVHEGQWIESDYPVGSANQDHQQLGSAMTYARRYSLFPMLQIAAEEDKDGEGAESQAPAPRQQQSEQPQQQAKPADTVEQWVQGAKNSLDNLRFGTEISQWESANKDNLARLEAKHPEHHKDLMAHKDARVQKLPMRAEAAE